MTFPVFSSWPTAICNYLPSTSGSCLDAYQHSKNGINHVPHRYWITDMHRQVHVHASMPCKFNHYMHACLAPNYPEALSSCRQSAFAEMLSPVRRSREASQRGASMLVRYNKITRVARNHKIQMQKTWKCQIRECLVLLEARSIQYNTVNSLPLQCNDTCIAL